MPFRKAGRSAAVEPSPDARWIYGPWVDLTVGCAAWSAPLMLFAGRSNQADTRGWAVVFYLFALAFNYPHYMATVYRAYHTHTEWTKYRVFTLHLTALLVLVGVGAHAWAALLPWVFTLYVTWSPWHYTGQNFGLLMMFARRNGAAPTDGERRALYLAFLGSYLLLFLGFHTGSSADPLVRSIGIPEALSNPARLVLLVAVALAGGVTLVRMIARAGLPAMLAPFTLVATQCIWFVVPALVGWTTGQVGPQTRYSAGILAVMHSAQYLWITSYYARREAEAAPGGVWRPWSYVGTLLAGGIALFVPGPWLASYVFRFDFTTSVLIFTAVVNLHHFVLDGAIWKLRDGRVAALLIGSRSRMAASSADAGRAVAGATRWLVSDVPSAKRVRVLALVTLGAWAAIDQARFIFATDAGNLSALTRASVLNPYDQLVRERKARLLIEQGAFQAAYDLYRRDSTSRLDGQALVNVGVLALRLGKEEEALTSWQQAADTDPEPLPLRRYLARAWAARADRLDQAGEIEAAARAFNRALALDDQVGDRANTATDWFNYGQFLKRQDVEPRLVLACLITAEELLAALSDSRLATVRDVRAAVERSHSEAAEAARKDLAGALAAARTRYKAAPPH